MWTFDHLVVAAQRLEDGVDWVESQLGVSLAKGGRHETMGTWNKVISLGPGEYLEVIAIDPDAPTPDHPRWFDLDRFSSTPKLLTWAARVPDLNRELKGTDLGQALPMRRGDYSWSFSLRDDGKLAFDGAHPALIEWGELHPADRLVDQGFRMTRLRLAHPDPDLAGQIAIPDDRIDVAKGPLVLRAEFQTPRGERCLTS